jgi:hypothetical protein
MIRTELYEAIAEVAEGEATVLAALLAQLFTDGYLAAGGGFPHSMTSGRLVVAAARQWIKDEDGEEPEGWIETDGKTHTIPRTVVDHMYRRDPTRTRTVCHCRRHLMLHRYVSGWDKDTGKRGMPPKLGDLGTDTGFLPLHARPCRACEGTGRVTSSRWNGVDDRCPDCDGRGRGRERDTRSLLRRSGRCHICFAEGSENVDHCVNAYCACPGCGLPGQYQQGECADCDWKTLSTDGVSMSPERERADHLGGGER